MLAAHQVLPERPRILILRRAPLGIGAWDNAGPAIAARDPARGGIDHRHQRAGWHGAATQLGLNTERDPRRLARLPPAIARVQDRERRGAETLAQGRGVSDVRRRLGEQILQVVVVEAGQGQRKAKLLKLAKLKREQVLVPLRILGQPVVGNR
jgi:hypothetical protein